MGINGRLDTIQAAILLAKFEIFEKEIILRNNVAKTYTKLLSDIVITPKIKSYNTSVYAQYCILSDKREQIIQNLRKNDIPYALYYPIPLHLQKVFSYLDYKEGDFPIAEKISKKILALPMHPYLKYEQQIKIVNIIKQSL